MSERTRGGATYDDVVRAPADRIAEVAAGDLFLSPRPSPRHARVASALTTDLHDAFDRGRSGPGGWWVLFEPELHLDGSILVPDIAAWRRDRLPELPDNSWFDLAPDWVCEIVSPSTEDFDRNLKLPLYAVSGVSHLWLVDPRVRRLEVYTREKGGWRLDSAFTQADAVCAEPFSSVAIELERLWS